MRRLSARRVLHIAISLLVGWSHVAASQEAREPFLSSPYLHTHHWAYPYVDLLLERGILSGLSPVVRPHRRVDVARAVLVADTARAGTVERAWLARLRRALEPEVRALGDGGRAAWLGVDLALEGTALTHSHRDPLRAAGASRLGGALEADVIFAAPGIAGESRLRMDTYYRNDIQLPERKVVENGYVLRPEDAYLEAQSRYARLLVGRVYRSWAPSRVQGTILSDYAYSYDQVAIWVGTPLLSLSLLAARLDDFPGGVHRYVAAHRFDVQPSNDLALYFQEAILYAGPGRDFELGFLNPLTFWTNENVDLRPVRETETNNAMFGLGFWWRAKPSLIALGDLLIDDVQWRPFDPDGFPPRYAFYAGVVFPRLSESTAGRVLYTQVGNLTYRTLLDYERYAYRDLGLARDFADYDLVRAELDWLALPDLWVTPRVELMRRGEGDLRDPLPPDPDALRREDVFLSGTTETTLRLSVAGRAHPRPWMMLEWDAGPSFVWNAGHVQGAEDALFAGRLTLRLVTRRSGLLE